MNKKAQGLITALIGLMILIIVGVAVTIPVVNSVIANASLTGSTGLIVSYIPLMIALVIFIAVAMLVSHR